ncbi:hypothetical protein P389DRAFT_35316 [Cystobasidium minutum MCA 4210]|uniref:uncharacterized protein n=1 Tax=Cystobasidium minutum MCA 4210 TaxID=1397322 RepID=UPI0034CF07BF|eukprot:jgi/Rhomi1/35316/CE35315_18
MLWVRGPLLEGSLYDCMSGQLRWKLDFYRGGITTGCQRRHLTATGFFCQLLGGAMWCVHRAEQSKFIATWICTKSDFFLKLLDFF